MNAKLFIMYMGGFFKEINDWIEEGCKQHPVFSVHAPLCPSLDNWLKANFPEENVVVVGEYFYDQLSKKFGTGYCPFNEDGYEAAGERVNGLVYKNEKRLAFIKHHAGNEL